MYIHEEKLWGDTEEEEVVLQCNMYTYMDLSHEKTDKNTDCSVPMNE